MLGALKDSWELAKYVYEEYGVVLMVAVFIGFWIERARQKIWGF